MSGNLEDELKDNLYNGMINKVGDFFEIDKLNDKQSEVAVILFDGLCKYLMKNSKINPKQRGK